MFHECWLLMYLFFKIGDLIAETPRHAYSRTPRTLIMRMSRASARVGDVEITK